MTGETPAHDEFDLKGRFWSSAIVDARLHESFEGADLRAAALLLAELAGEDPSGDADISDLTSCRLMLDALKVAEGDVARLAMWVQAARMDPRDLIAAAEYRRELQGAAGEGSARDADLADYLAWVSGSPSGEDD